MIATRAILLSVQQLDVFELAKEMSSGRPLPAFNRSGKLVLTNCFTRRQQNRLFDLADRIEDERKREVTK